MKTEKLEFELPRGIKSSSLVDVSQLNLRDEAANRVAMKISEAVLSEYTRIEKPSGLVIAGRISDITKIDIPREWIGIIVPDIDLLRKEGFASLDKTVPQLFK